MVKLSSGGSTQILNTLTATNAIETINAPLQIQGVGGTYTLANNSANGSGTGEGTLNIGGGITGGAVGATVLTLSGSNTNANTVGGIIGNRLAITLGLVKSGIGTWVLTGANSYTGTQSLTLANSDLSTTGNVSVGRGTLAMLGTSDMTLGGQLQSNCDWAIFRMQDTTSVTAAGGVDLTANGVIASSLYFNGGTLTTSSITGNDFIGATHILLNGGTVNASANNPDFLRVQVTANGDFHSGTGELGNGGSNFNTNGFDTGIQLFHHYRRKPRPQLRRHRQLCGQFLECGTHLDDRRSRQRSNRHRRHRAVHPWNHHRRLSSCGGQFQRHPRGGRR